MELSRQHHIAIIASDWEKTRAFYVDRLGFSLTREVWREAQQDYLRMLQLGNTTLEIFIKPNAPKRVTDPEALGLRHLAFHVENVVQAAAWLNEKGIETEPIREDLVNGGKFTFFRDPDGLPLELHE